MLETLLLICSAPMLKGRLFSANISSYMSRLLWTPSLIALSRQRACSDETMMCCCRKKQKRAYEKRRGNEMAAVLRLNVKVEALGPCRRQQHSQCGCRRGRSIPSDDCSQRWLPSINTSVSDCFLVSVLHRQAQANLDIHTCL